MRRGAARPLKLLEYKVLSKSEVDEISELRRLRNIAVHDEVFDETVTNSV